MLKLFIILDIINLFMCSLLTLVPIMLSVALFTLTERKVMGAIQRRRGPQIVGFFGLMQPIADALKLFLKELFVTSLSNKFLFFLAPVITLFLSFLGWAVIPFNHNNVIADINLGSLYLLTLSSLGIYGILISGWASNSKYAFLGSVRSVAQMISYEIFLSFSLLPVFLCSGSLNLIDIVFKQRLIWYCFPLFPLCVIFFIAILAETNRAPFDLAEAEAEIVAGYNLEYSSITFAMFFLGEYSSMLLMSSFFIILFLGGWLPPHFLNVYLNIIPFEFWFSLKLGILAFLFILIRANYPRVRYDQLMDLGWKIFLPITFSYLIYIIGHLTHCGGLPYNLLFLEFQYENYLSGGLVEYNFDII